MGMTTSFDASKPLLTLTPGPGTEVAARRRLARVPIDQPTGLTGRLVGWLSRKLYGQAPDNGFAMAHNRKVLLATLFHERRVAKFDRLDPGLKALATMEVAAEMVTPLRDALGDDGLVELTMMVAIENERSRFNAALGLVSQGFSAACQLPSNRG